MTDDTIIDSSSFDADGAKDERRVYELGYLAVSTLSEQDLTSVVDSVKELAKNAGGTIISEAAPEELTLAYTMYTREKEKNIPHEKAFFGWVKVELDSQSAAIFKSTVDQNKLFIRTLLFVTVAEDTRAKLAPQALREVKATGTITAPKKAEGATQATDTELDKTVDSIVADLV